MSDTSTGAGALIRAARAAAEAFIAALDEVEPTTASPGERTATRDLIEYDPLRDEPPFTPNPTMAATAAQQLMAWITYLGAIGRLNFEEGRGANPKEVSEFAKKAGYSGGNAVNGWNSRPGSPRLVENINGERFLNTAGLTGIKKDATKLGIKLLGEFAPIPQPE